MPLVILFFKPSSNSFEVLTTPQPSSFQRIEDLLGSELPHYPQALGHVQLSQLCHTPSSCCFCAYVLGGDAVDWEGWEMQVQGWKRNLGA